MSCTGLISHLIHWVKIELESSGEVVAFATFDGHGSDKMTWMNQNRLMDCSWDDLAEYMDAKPVAVSLEGR